MIWLLIAVGLCVLFQTAVFIASDMMLIGVVDSELISCVGEFCLSLLQQGTMPTPLLESVDLVFSALLSFTWDIKSCSTPLCWHHFTLSHFPLVFIWSCEAFGLLLVHKPYCFEEFFIYSSNLVLTKC